MDGAYARRAEQAQAGQQTELDKLLADATVEGRARRKADEEPLDQLMGKLRDPLKTASVSELRREIASIKARAQGLDFKKDPLHAHKWHLHIARLERFLAIREREEREQPHVNEKSAAWLASSLHHSSIQPAQQPAAGAQRQVQPSPMGAPGRSSREFGGLDYEHDGGPGARQLQASRGAPPTKTKRVQSLLQPTIAGKQGRRQQRTDSQQQQHQQHQRQSGDAGDLCKLCGQPPAPGSPLRLVHVKNDGFADKVLACFRCLNERNLQPVIARSAPQGSKHVAVAEQAVQQAAATHAPAANAKAHAFGRLQGLRPPLSLKPTVPFYSGTPSAPNALLDVGGSVGRAAGGSAPARQPTRGKGKQQRRGDDDGDWLPDERAAQQQQQADADEDSDFEWQSVLPRQRRLRQRQRAQAANAEPVTIDLLSDEDPEHQQQQQQQQQQPAGCDGLAEAAMPAPAAAEGDEGRTRPPRATRAAQYVSTSDRFKGLKCLYPRSGGPGAVEVTALDLSRLDDGEFLNDTVIDFYIRWLQDQLPPEVLERCYFFNTFFFKKLMEDQGGTLTPELREWAEQERMKNHKLQALHNHQKVKKWTKDVDLFAKDFIFVPVHEALHWSLMVVCHPGVVMPRDGSAQRPGAPTPCILHLDSLSGSHRAVKLANNLRLYLNFEWHIKSLPDAPDGVPKRWAEAHPGEKRSWLHTDFPNKAARVPGQENHCDCGLFMCSYIEYFVHRLPPAINIHDLEALKSYAKTNRDLFEGTDDCVPGLLTDKWFPKDNPSHLRWRLRHNILRLMAEECGLMDPATHQWAEGSPMVDEVQRELLQLQQRSLEYLSPAEWESRALANKQQRAQALRRREMEEAERKAARQQRQAAAAKSPGSTRGGSVDRERLAAAAEARLGHEQPSALFNGIREVAAHGEDEGSDLSFEHQARQPALQGAVDVQPQQQPLKPSLRLQRHSREPSPKEAQLREELEDREPCQQSAGSEPDCGGFEVVLNGSDGDDGDEGDAQEGVARDIVAGAGLQHEPAVSEDLCPVPGSPSVATGGGSPLPEHAPEPSSADWLRGGAQPGAALGPAAQLQQQASEEEEIHVFNRRRKKQKQRQRQQQGALELGDGPCTDPMQHLEERLVGEELQHGVPPQQAVFSRDGAVTELDWALVVEVAGVYSNSRGQETQQPDDRCTAELRFFYLDTAGYSARLPFPADCTTGSVDSLCSWVRSHSQHLDRPRWDLQRLEAWNSSQAADQQHPGEMHRSSEQGNGEATAHTRRGRSVADGNAPLDGCAAASAAVAAARFQQQQQQQQQQRPGVTDRADDEGEVLDIDSTLPSMPSTQPIPVPHTGSQELYASGPEAAAPAEDHAPCAPPAQQRSEGFGATAGHLFSPLVGSAHADLEQTDSGQIQQELQSLHLQPQPRPARAAAAAAALQHKHDRQRQAGLLAAAAAAPLPDQQEQAAVMDLTADEAAGMPEQQPEEDTPGASAAQWEQAPPGNDAPVRSGGSKRLHAAAPRGLGAGLAGKRRRKSGEPRRLEHSAGSEDEAPAQVQQQQEPPQRQWNPHLLQRDTSSGDGVPPPEVSAHAGQAAARRQHIPKPTPPSSRPGSVALRLVHNASRHDVAASRGSDHTQLGGPSRCDQGSIGQPAGQPPSTSSPSPCGGLGRPAPYDPRYAVHAAVLADDAVAAAARQMQHAQEQPLQQLHAAQPAPATAEAVEAGMGWLAQHGQERRRQQYAQLAEPQGAGFWPNLTTNEVETALQHVHSPTLGSQVKQIGMSMKAATGRLEAQQRQEKQAKYKRPRRGGKQASIARHLRPIDSVDLVSDDE